MCLLTFMQAGVTADIADLSNGAINNPDGFGFAVHAGNRVIHNSGLNFDRVLDEFLKVRAKHSGPALFHSRITTHGSTSRDNCHPFQVGRDRDTVMAHNGMLPIKDDGVRSDTRIFAESMFPSWGGTRTLNSRKMRKRLAKFATGSKLVFITANSEVNDDFVIINEKLGHWCDGVWWSNSSYAYKPYLSTGWRKVTPDAYGWDLDDDEDEGVAPYLAGNAYGLTEDCTYVDASGNIVWGELWTCGMCGKTEYIDEDNINTTDFCPHCDACWYCTDDRVLCNCWHEPQRDALDVVTINGATVNKWTPTLWGYDKSINEGSMY
jgi:hypothetical protein